MKWDEGFRAYSSIVSPRTPGGRRREPAAFGGFLGLGSEKTITDLKRLIEAKDQEFAQIEGNYQDKIRTGVKVDTDWLKDYSNLKARYQTAKDDAQKAMKSSGGFLPSASFTALFAEGLTNAQKYYDALLKALQQTYPEMRTSKGDLQDIFNRMPFAMQPLPQHSATPSSQVYQATDTFAQYTPDPVKGVVATLTPGLVPKTIDKPNYENAANKLKMGLGIGTIALIAGGALVAVAALKK